MILAAGYGERLKPESLKKPKPLFAIGKTNMIRNAIGYLVHHGIKEIAVNLHHLGGMIKSDLSEIKKSGLAIHFSEEAELLGTAGGIKAVEPFMAGSPFVVINSDILIDLDLENAMRFHNEKGALATLVVRDNPSPAKFGMLAVDTGDKLIRFLNAFSPTAKDACAVSLKMFTGVHIFSPEMFRHIPAGRPVNISTEVYPKLVESGEPLFAFDHSGYWADIGSAESYNAACRDVADKKFKPYEL